MNPNLVNLSSPEQTIQDANYVSDTPVRIQDILVYTIENGFHFTDIYALGFSDATGRLRCFDAYDIAFKAKRQERWMCRLIDGVSDETK